LLTLIGYDVIHFKPFAGEAEKKIEFLGLKKKDLSNISEGSGSLSQHKYL
jgi:hypothetical protein